MKNVVHLIDCMEFMKDLPDNAYDLAVVDPPYGIDVANMNMGCGKSSKTSNVNNRLWVPKNWDMQKPQKEYFDTLFRISSMQIIWGGNYFLLPVSGRFCIWDKGPGMRCRSFAECEYAWISNGTTRITTISPVDKNRIHPTQKPVALYKWLLKNYAKPGQTIFDSHVGSGSIRIACHDLGFDFEGCELDEDYWKAQEERYKSHAAQGDLFGTDEIQQSVYRIDSDELKW